MSTTRARGRPRTFDQDEVLDALMKLFWEQGYEATSVAEIAEAAGLNKSSLYNAFGSKDELFQQVLDRYVDARAGMFEAVVADASPGVAGLHELIEFLRLQTRDPMGRNGCLAVNTSAELGCGDGKLIEMAEHYRQRMAGGIRTLVEGAAQAGELDPDQVDNHVDMLTMFLLGMSITMRSGASTDELDRLVDAAHATVDSWRI